MLQGAFLCFCKQINTIEQHNNDTNLLGFLQVYTTYTYMLKVRSTKKIAFLKKKKKKGSLGYILTSPHKNIKKLFSSGENTLQ